MISLKHRRFIQKARALSKKSSDKVRIGAIVVKNGNIFSTGYNSMEKSHPTMAALCKWKHIHAEFAALICTYRYDLTGATIYIGRELLNGKVGMCRPCVDCILLLQEAGVRQAFYTDPNAEGEIEILDLRYL